MDSNKERREEHKMETNTYEKYMIEKKVPLREEDFISRTVVTFDKEGRRSINIIVSDARRRLDYVDNIPLPPVMIRTLIHMLPRFAGFRLWGNNTMILDK